MNNTLKTVLAYFAGFMTSAVVISLGIISVPVQLTLASLNLSKETAAAVTSIFDLIAFIVLFILIARKLSPKKNNEN